MSNKSIILGASEGQAALSDAKGKGEKQKRNSELFVRQPRVERGSTAWKAAMITVTPLALVVDVKLISQTYE